MCAVCDAQLLLLCCSDTFVACVAHLLSCAGDGAGMLCAMPDSFFSAVLMDEQSFKLPPLGDYAVGMVSCLTANIRQTHSEHTAARACRVLQRCQKQGRFCSSSQYITDSEG